LGLDIHNTGTFCVAGIGCGGAIVEREAVAAMWVRYFWWYACRNNVRGEFAARYARYG